MLPVLLAQLKILMTSVAAVAMTLTPTPIQQGVNSLAGTGNTSTNISSNGNSRNWSGYISNSGTYTLVAGTWTIPQATSSGHTATDATWIGIGGVSANDLIQAGTQNVVNPSGQVQTTAFYELLPNASVPITTFSVKPGDSITVTISQQSSGQWLININDNTTNQNFQTTVSYTSSTSSAEWIEEAPSNGKNVLPLDNFDTINFSNGSTTVNGSQISISASNAHAVTMVNNSGQALATPSSLGSDGASFTVTRSSATSTSPIPSFDRNPGGWRRRGRGIGPFSVYPRGYYHPVPSTDISPSPVPSSTPNVAPPATVHVFQFRHAGRFIFHRF